MLYADCYQTRAEFREMFDHRLSAPAFLLHLLISSLRLYDKMRAKYSAIEAFPEVYEKIKRPDV